MTDSATIKEFMIISERSRMNFATSLITFTRRRLPPLSFLLLFTSRTVPSAEAASSLCANLAEPQIIHRSPLL